MIPLQIKKYHIYYKLYTVLLLQIMLSINQKNKWIVYYLLFLIFKLNQFNYIVPYDYLSIA